MRTALFFLTILAIPIIAVAQSVSVTLALNKNESLQFSGIRPQSIDGLDPIREFSFFKSPSSESPKLLKAFLSQEKIKSATIGFDDKTRHTYYLEDITLKKLTLKNVTVNDRGFEFNRMMELIILRASRIQWIGNSFFEEGKLIQVKFGWDFNEGKPWNRNSENSDINGFKLYDP